MVTSQPYFVRTMSQARMQSIRAGVMAAMQCVLAHNCVADITA